MTTPILKLTNTLTREKQDFIPLDPKNVGMYVCGITPYDDAHIGHARVYVVFDVLFRLLRHLYGESHVKYVRNFTDIDDKIITRAAENGEEPLVLANRIIASFHADMAALNTLPPTEEPRVSTSIPGIVQMVDDLIAKGFAYQTPSGDVMYRTARFPKYGALARRKLDEQQHGTRVNVDAEKENPNDFVLWKANAKSAAKLEQAFNPADYNAQHFTAPGRPGWHIECSVMSKEHLGLPFDIHGGGEDLIFPHHCCEIAQTEALMAPGQDMARYWVHNSFITVNGTKMSKSLGNFTTIKDALAKYSPEAIRLWLLQTHYRKPVDFSDEALQAAENYLTRMYSLLRTLEVDLTKIQEEKTGWAELFLKELSDDLNTSNALAMLNIKVKMMTDTKLSLDEKKKEAREVKAYANILGILQYNPSKFLEGFGALDTTKIGLLMERRAFARAGKEWQKSDEIRKELESMGVVVEDKPDGTTTWRRA